VAGQCKIFPRTQPVDFTWRAGLEFSDECRFWLARQRAFENKFYPW
jgi:hypothetical protein